MLGINCAMLENHKENCYPSAENIVRMLQYYFNKTKDKKLVVAVT